MNQTAQMTYTRTYKVQIESINRCGEQEWKEIIESEASMTGARRKATNWIKRNLFSDDYADIDKQQVHSGFEYWTLR